MRFPIVSIPELKELAIIELQGSIATHKEGLVGHEFGPLHMKGDRAEMTIGNHLLVGKLHKLPKPLCVVKRGSKEEHQLTIFATVRYKIVFPERPIIIFPEMM